MQSYHGTFHGQRHNFNNNMAKTITITTTGYNSPHTSLEAWLDHQLMHNSPFHSLAMPMLSTCAPMPMTIVFMPIQAHVEHHYIQQQHHCQ
jgi:hypothetical protein